MTEVYLVRHVDENDSDGNYFIGVFASLDSARACASDGTNATCHGGDHERAAP